MLSELQSYLKKGNMLNVQERIYVFTSELLNLNFETFLDRASKCRIHIYFFKERDWLYFFFGVICFWYCNVSTT